MTYSDVKEEYFQGILYGQDDNQKEIFANRLNDAASVNGVRRSLIKCAPFMGIPSSILRWPNGKPADPPASSIQKKSLNQKKEADENFVYPANMQWEPYSRSLFGKLVRNLAIIVCTTKISDIPYAASLQYQSLLNERRLLLWTCEEYHQRLMGKVINLERLAKRANPTTEFQFVPLMHYNRQVPISSQSSYQVQKNSANNCASLAPDLSQSSVLDRTLRRESTSSTTNRSLSLNELMQRPSSSVNRSFLDKTLPIRMELNIHQLY